MLSVSQDDRHQYLYSKVMSSACEASVTNRAYKSLYTVQRLPLMECALLTLDHNQRGVELKEQERYVIKILFVWRF